MPKKYRHDVLGEFASALEAIAALGSAAVLEPVAGLAGAAVTPFKGVDAGVETINKISSLGYAPRDPRVMNLMGKALQPVGEAAMKGKQYLGDKTLDATGSPGLAAIASISPEILATLTGLRVAKPAMGQPGVAMKPRYKSPDTTDMSRRKFLKDAGIVGAGAALGAKGLLDIPEGVATKAAPVAATAAKTAFKAAPKDYSLLSVLNKHPELITKIKNKVFDDKSELYDGTPVTVVTDNDGRRYIVEERYINEGLLKAAETGDFALDTSKIPRHDYHDPNTLKHVFDEFYGDYGDKPVFMYSSIDGNKETYRPYKNAEEVFNDPYDTNPLLLIMEAIGNGVETANGLSKLHPSDVKKSLQILSDKYPGDKVLKELADMDNETLLRRVNAHWEEVGTVYDDGYLHGNWVLNPPE